MFEEIDYATSLETPNGYTLNRIIATTYSLEPQLLFLLACLFEYDEKNKALYSDLGVLKSLSSFYYHSSIKDIISEKRLVIFYQSDKFNYSLTQTEDTFSALLRECCKPIKKNQFAFHPKIILAEFVSKNDESPIIHRLLVSSRNLTSSSLFETQVILQKESPVLIPKELYTNTEELYTSINGLINYINEEQFQWKVLKNSGDELTHATVHFQMPQQKQLFKEMCLDKDAYPKIILSPYYSGTDEINNASFYRGENVHSKLFCVKHEDKTKLWIGSANCTINGLNNNYECMTCLTFNEDISEKFEKWLKDNSFKKIAGEPERTPSSLEMSQVEIVLEHCNFKCSIKKSPVSLKYNVSFEIATNDESVSFSGIKTELLTKKNVKDLAKKIVFENIPLSEVTNGLIIKGASSNSDEPSLSRIVFAEFADEDTKKILQECTKKLAGRKLNSIFPDFMLETPEPSDNDSSYKNTEKDSSSSCISFSPADKDYEKMLKLYAYGKIDLLKDILTKLDRHQEAYNEDAGKYIIEWLKCLTKEETR